MLVYQGIATYLKQVGLKQKVVAEKAGISEKKFSALMTGRSTLNADDLMKICIVLNVSPEEFVTFKRDGETKAGEDDETV